MKLPVFFFFLLFLLGTVGTAQAQQGGHSPAWGQALDRITTTSQCVTYGSAFSTHTLPVSVMCSPTTLFSRHTPPPDPRQSALTEIFLGSAFLTPSIAFTLTYALYARELANQWSLELLFLL